MRLLLGKDHRFFADGYGDLARCEELEGMVDKGIDVAFPDIHHMEWEDDTHGLEQQGEVSVRNASFASPCGAFTCEESKTAYVQVVAPAGGRHVRGVVIHLPQTGDMGYGFRRKTLGIPLALEGYASIILVGPYYGKRKPRSQRRHYVRNVAEYLISASTTFTEAAKLVKWAQQEWPDTHVCLSGISYGGAMAACAASILPASVAAGGVAVAPCVSSSSPKAIVGGLLVSQIDWQTLMEEKSHTRQQAYDHLSEILAARDLRELIHHTHTNAHVHVQGLKCVVTTASHDRFVVRSDGLALIKELVRMCGTVEEVWLEGGHVSSIARCTRVFVPSIRRAFQLMDGKT